MNALTKRLVVQYVLKETREKATYLSTLRNNLTITEEAFKFILRELCSGQLIDIDEDIVTASLDQRLELAVLAIKLGADFQEVSNSLGWLEFEELVARVFQENGYHTMSRYRFQAQGRRWEIDVLATNYPYIVCAECKHYTSNLGNSLARTIIESHIEKTEVLGKNIDKVAKKIGVQEWKNAIIIPITLTLQPTRMKLYRRVPSVSVFMLPSFLSEFPGYLERLIHNAVEIPEYKHKPKQLKLR